jgi:hypothetical protein
MAEDYVRHYHLLLGRRSTPNQELIRTAPCTSGAAVEIA